MAYTVTVLDVVTETADSRSLVLGVPDEDRERFRYRPGQFLTLRIPCGDRPAIARCYSLASAPGVDADLVVTVKRVAGGVGSGWVCDQVRPGDLIEVLPPAGLFTPDRLDADLLLFAAGSGITPVFSILKAMLDQPRGTAVLVYANRDENSVIFAAELRALAARAPERLQVIHLLESVQGLPTSAMLTALAAPHVGRDAAFVCGPEPFMDATVEALRAAGMTSDRIVLERFQSLNGDPFAERAPAAVADEGPSTRLTVTLNGDRRELTWRTDTTLVDRLLAEGLQPPYSCREGACSACACRIVSGDVKMLRNDVLEEEDLADGWVLGCQAVPVTDEVELSYDD